MLYWVRHVKFNYMLAWEIDKQKNDVESFSQARIVWLSVMISKHLVYISNCHLKICTRKYHRLDIEVPSF
jgi:hypothetical protein